MKKPFRPVFAGLVVMLAAVAVSTAVAVFGVSAQAGPTIGFTDGAGTAINHVVVPDIDGTAVVQLHISGTGLSDVNVAQISIKHDPAQVTISATCDVIFTPPTPTPPPTPMPTATPTPPTSAWTGRNIADGSTWFICGTTSSIGPSSSRIMDLTITRKAGEPTLSFSTTGTLPTRLFEPPSVENPTGVTFDLIPAGPLSVLESPPPPTPTPTSTPVPNTPTPVPTATVPSGGGGGGGGGAPPAPTSGPGLQAPGAPQDVIVTPIVNGAAVNWQVPQDDGGSPVTGYRVLVVPSGQAVVVSAQQTSVNIRGLDPEQSYQFQVNAINSIGTGPSAPITAAINPLEPLGAPQSVSATLGENGTSAIVTWQAPTETGSGPVTGYIITSDPVAGEGFAVGPGVLSATYTGLSRSTSYRFSVRARNSDSESPLSEPSNEVLTAPGSGAPTDPPTATSTAPRIIANNLELADFEDAVSDAFGAQITLDGAGPSITPSEGGLLLEFPTEPISGSSSSPGPLKSKVGNLNLDIENGTGTATLVIDEHVSITGPAQVEAEASSVQVQINDPTLMFKPPTPEEFSGSSGLVTQVGAEFGVAMSGLPGAIGLAAEFIGDITTIPAEVTSFQLAAAGSGGEIEDPASDIAFVVLVGKKDITNDDLGDNSVSLTVSREWYEDRVASGKEIFITKIGDDGVSHTLPASCELEGDLARCTVVFTGLAGGFSLFGVVAISPDDSGNQGGATPTPTPPAATATPTSVPTATQPPSPTPAPQPTSSPVATVAPTSTPRPTATPLSALQPTPQSTQPVDPDLPGEPDESGGGMPWWASVLIALGVIAIVAPATGGAYTIWRRQRPG